MLVLIGESASGKSCIEKELVENYGYNKIVTYTTRPPRNGEINGVDYHFVSEDEFNKLSECNFFAEHAVYNGWHYGSAIKDYINDKNVIVLTPNGLRQIKRNIGLNIVSIYINVSRRDRLIKILQRGDNIDESYRRNSSDVGQFDGIKNEVDYVIDNYGYKNNPKIMARQIDFIHNTMLKSKRKINTILCDIDEVVNDLTFKILKSYNRKYNDTLTFEDIKEYEIKKFLKPECKDIFKEFCTDKFLYSLNMQPQAKEVIEELIKNYNFYFVTSKYPENVKVTDIWLKHHIDGYNNKMLIICQNKSLICGDLLIDDCLDNFTSNRKYSLIFDKPWNRKAIEDNVRTFRVYGWEDIKNIINELNMENKQ